MSAEPANGTRDLIVVGCSAGGVEALPRLLAPLPKDLPAALVVVQHMGASNNPMLVDILRRSSLLPVSWADQGARIERSHVYVCPPDTHLLFNGDHIRLTSGPRENHARPSIDKLFRSAAAEHSSRVVGVLLTGMLDDGVSGLLEIQKAGGIVIIQDPEDAAYPELPSRALQAVEPDRVLPITAIPTALSMICAQPRGLPGVSRALALEAEVDRQGSVDPASLHSLGPQTPIACPDCSGPTWLIGDENTRRYRCYLGHVSSARELLVQQSLEVEAALWSAVRALHERAMTLETLAADADRVGSNGVGDLYAQRAKETRIQAELARKFLVEVIKPT
ncbi:MAG: chemotaxis protein CheB [Deltaproteobacteria bacterium]|nr:chemotaxis protein CheB [Deltaproteobacteria bacterium]